MNFDGQYRFKNNIPLTEKVYWFIFRQDKILTAIADSVTKPLCVAAQDLPGIRIDTALHVGRLDAIDCYAIPDDEEKIELPETQWVPLRLFHGKFNEEMFWIYGRARHLLTWSVNNRFCGRCGNPPALKSDERTYFCPSCGLVSYPRISPAVIVSSEKDGKILLARSTRFPGGMSSVIAGFVEPGETLEACAEREIREETGLEIQNLRYFTSQPWPFPDSLMVGFTAEYAGGELSIDQNEIVEARWYGPDELPVIPGKLSISRMLIDHFVEKCQKGVS